MRPGPLDQTAGVDMQVGRRSMADHQVLRTKAGVVIELDSSPPLSWTDTRADDAVSIYIMQRSRRLPRRNSGGSRGDRGV